MKKNYGKSVLVLAVVCTAVFICGCRCQKENRETTFCPSANWYTVEKVFRESGRNGEFSCKLVYTDWPWDFVKVGKKSKYIFIQAGDEVCLHDHEIVDVIYHMFPGERRVEHFRRRDRELRLGSEDKVVYDKQPVPDSVRYGYKPITEVQQSFWGRIFVVGGREVRVEGKPANLKNKQLFLRKGDLVRLNDAGRITDIIWKNAPGENKRTVLVQTMSGKIKEKALVFTRRDSVVITR